MGMSVPTNVAPADIFKGGGGIPAPGVYHCQVEHVNEVGDKGYVEIKCQIVSPGSEQGKTFDHRVYAVSDKPEWAEDTTKKYVRTGITLGCDTMEQYEADQAAGTDHEIEWVNAIGHQFIGDLKERKFKYADGSDGHGVKASIYPVDHSAMHEKVLKGVGFEVDLLGLVLPNGLPPATTKPPANAPSQAKAPTQQPPQQQQQAKAPTQAQSVYDDI